MILNLIRDIDFIIYVKSPLFFLVERSIDGSSSFHSISSSLITQMLIHDLRDAV